MLRGVRTAPLVKEDLLKTGERWVHDCFLKGAYDSIET